MLTGDNVCEWCRADYYRRTSGPTLRDGRQVLRCPRCNQPDHTCNEIAGRPFRMTWHRSLRSLGEAAHPRMPAVRCTFAIERMHFYFRTFVIWTERWREVDTLVWNRQRLLFENRPAALPRRYDLWDR